MKKGISKAVSKLENYTELPVANMCGEFSAELCGDRQLTVYGCMSVVKYECDCVVIEVKNTNIFIYGDSLALESFSDKTIMVSGLICKIELGDFKC